MKFKNPLNNFVEEISEFTWLWTLLFGSIYFAVKGVWSHALISFILAGITFGVSWLIYPFFAKSIVEKKFRQNGWVQIEPEPIT